LGERSQHDLRRGLGIGRVERRLVAVVGGLVLRRPRGTGTLELADVDTTEGQVRAIAGRAGAVIPRLLVDAVRAEHLDARIPGLDVLPQLGRAVAGDRTDEDDVGPGGLD